MNPSNYFISKNSNDKLSFESKANLNFLNKHKSDNTLPYVICNEFNKSLFTGINQMSEISTKNSSGLKEKNQKIKKRIGINIFEKLNSEKIDKIVDKKSKAFEALENLLINDNVNNNYYDEKLKNSEIKKEKVKKKLSLIVKTNNDKKKLKKKIRKSLSIPKLDFSNIFNQYNNPFYIKEVEYISQFKVEDSNDTDSNSEKIEWVIIIITVIIKNQKIKEIKNVLNIIVYINKLKYNYAYSYYISLFSYLKNIIN